MLKVNVAEDCGNSPKNQLIQDLCVAFAKGDRRSALSRVTDDICWTTPDGRRVQGRAELVQALDDLKREQILELNIRHALSHGRAGAVDGDIRLRDGRRRAFCHVCDFNCVKGDLVKAVTTYWVELD